MAKLIFLICALILASTSSAYPAESDIQISEVETTTTEVATEATEISENDTAEEEIKDEEIAKIVAKAKETISKKQKTIDTLTNKLLRDAQKIKTSNSDSYEKQKKYLRKIADIYKANNAKVDLTECDKLIPIFDESVSVAVKRVDNCIQSVENVVQNFILKFIEKTNKVLEHLSVIDKSVVACGEDKECRAVLEEKARTKVNQMSHEINKDIALFTVKSVYYHPKLRYCSVLDDLELFWKPIGMSVQKYRICTEKAVKAAH